MLIYGLLYNTVCISNYIQLRDQTDKIFGRTVKATKNCRVDGVWPEIRTGHLQSNRTGATAAANSVAGGSDGIRMVTDHQDIIGFSLQRVRQSLRDRRCCAQVYQTVN
jgi:hypothetical protein